MGILYVETNFVVSIATGRSPGAMEILERPPASFVLILPAICYFEAFDWLEGEIKRVGRIRNELQGQIHECGRDVSSFHARLLSSFLLNAVTERDELLEEVGRRLFAAIRGLSATGEIAQLTARALDLARDEPLIGQLTDNLILHTILEHARSSVDPSKAFLTENHRDFGTTEVREALRVAGIEYFRSGENFLGWASSRSSPPDPNTPSAPAEAASEEQAG